MHQHKLGNVKPNRVDERTIYEWRIATTQSRPRAVVLTYRTYWIIHVLPSEEMSVIYQIPHERSHGHKLVCTILIIYTWETYKTFQHLCRVSLNIEYGTVDIFSSRF